MKALAWRPPGARKAGPGYLLAIRSVLLSFLFIVAGYIYYEDYAWQPFAAPTLACVYFLARSFVVGLRVDSETLYRVTWYRVVEFPPGEKTFKVVPYEGLICGYTEWFKMLSVVVVGPSCRGVQEIGVPEVAGLPWRLRRLARELNAQFQPEGASLQELFGASRLSWDDSDYGWGPKL